MSVPVASQLPQLLHRRVRFVARPDTAPVPAPAPPPWPPLLQWTWRVVHGVLKAPLLPSPQPEQPQRERIPVFAIS